MLSNNETSDDSDRWRTDITIWFLSFFDNILGLIQSWFNYSYQIMYDDWPKTSCEKIII